MARFIGFTLTACMSVTLIGCAGHQQAVDVGPISQSQMYLDEAAAMASAPNFNEGLARQIAVMERDRRINAEAAAQP